MRRFLFAVLILIIFGEPSSAAEYDFYVTPNGNDAWDGKSPEHKDGDSGPFATIQQAQKAARGLRASLEKTPRPINVQIKGEHYLKETLLFDAQDAGAAIMPLNFSGDDNTLISGGVKLTGFQADSKGVWHLKIPEVESGAWSFSELFINGKRRSRTRLPHAAFYFIAGEVPPTQNPTGKGYDRFHFVENQLKPNWHNLNDVEILPFHNWTMSRLRITEIDTQKSIVSLSGKTPNANPWNKLARGRRFLIENVLEELKNPGEWYLDNKSGILSYIPLPGETPENTICIAPRLEWLAVIKGASHIHFSNLAFKHCRVAFPAQGYASPQAEVRVPGAIYTERANHIALTHCTISQVGGYAVELGMGSKDCVLDDCDLTDLGAGGVKIGDMSYRDKAHEADLAERNTVTNCFIAYGGRHYPAAIGVLVLQSPFNTVEHNEIYDFYYTGLSVGWTWGYGNSNAHHNTFAWNHVHKIGQGVLTDMGAFYSLGISPGTTLHHNLFHDIESHDYGGWGIYFDEGSTGIVAENNIVYNTKTGGFHQHYGKENIVRNNILAFGQEAQLMRTRVEEHLSFTLERNLIYFNDQPVLGSNWKDAHFAIDNNLYWNVGTKPAKFIGMTFEEWRSKGHDTHSLFEDPLFVNAGKFDFTLKENSPAAKIGFKPIDLTGVGPARKRTLDDNFPRAFPGRPVPPKLPPQVIDDDFEGSAPGSKPALADVSEESNKGTVRVTEEAAASGKHSLKFTDVPGQKHAHDPFIAYHPGIVDGVADCVFNLRIEPGALFWHEWRNNETPYKSGPSIRVNKDGVLFAGSKELLKLPPSQWVKFELSAGLGKDASGKFSITVTLPGEAKKNFVGLQCNPECKSLEWLGFISLTDGASVFYLDDISVKQRK